MGGTALPLLCMQRNDAFASYQIISLQSRCRELGQRMRNLSLRAMQEQGRDVLKQIKVLRTEIIRMKELSNKRTKFDYPMCYTDSRIEEIFKRARDTAIQARDAQEYDDSLYQTIQDERFQLDRMARAFEDRIDALSHKTCRCIIL